MRVTKTPTDEINFDNIAAMLCGEELDETQQEDVKKLREQYDRKHKFKTKQSKDTED